MEILEGRLEHPETPDWIRVRAKCEQEMRKMGGRHLVLVQYAKEHSCHEEWVYNEAGIDSAPVVWARPMGPEGVQKLAAYFPDRRIWLLEINKDGLLDKNAEGRYGPVLLREPVRARR